MTNPNDVLIKVSSERTDHSPKWKTKIKGGGRELSSRSTLAVLSSGWRSSCVLTTRAGGTHTDTHSRHRMSLALTHSGKGEDERVKKGKKRHRIKYRALHLSSTLYICLHTDAHFNIFSISPGLIIIYNHFPTSTPQ